MLKRKKISSVKSRTLNNESTANSNEGNRLDPHHDHDDHIHHVIGSGSADSSIRKTNLGKRSLRTRNLKSKTIEDDGNRLLSDADEKKTDLKMPETPKVAKKLPPPLESPPSDGHMTGFTPLKDDGLLCSQSTESEVTWDCSSPGVTRMIKAGHNRGAKVMTADIIQDLYTKETRNVQGNTPPLLSIWVKEEETQRARKRSLLLQQKHRVRVKSRNKGLMFEAMTKRDKQLMESLAKSVKDDEEDEIHPMDPEAEFTEQEKCIPGESQDLFVTTGCDSHNSHAIAIATESEGEGLDESAWSDDDMFKDEAFIVRATQGETTSVSCHRGTKRKCEEDLGPSLNQGLPKKPWSLNDKGGNRSIQFRGDNQILERGDNQQQKLSFYNVTGDSAQMNKSSSPFRKTKSFNACESNQPSENFLKKRIGWRKSGSFSGVCESRINSDTNDKSSVIGTKAQLPPSGVPVDCVGVTVNPECVVDDTARKDNSNSVCDTARKDNSNYGPDKARKDNSNSFCDTARKDNSNYGPDIARKDYSKRVVCDTARKDNPNSVFDTARKDNSKCVVCDTTRKDYSKRVVCDTARKNNSNSVFDTARKDNSKHVVCDTARKDYSNSVVCDKAQTELTSPLSRVANQTHHKSLSLFDTSLTDDILCQLATADEMLETSVQEVTLGSQSSEVICHHPTKEQSCQQIKVSVQENYSEDLFPSDEDDSGLFEEEILAELDKIESQATQKIGSKGDNSSHPVRVSQDCPMETNGSSTICGSSWNRLPAHMPKRTASTVSVDSTRSVNTVSVDSTRCVSTVLLDAKNTELLASNVARVDNSACVSQGKYSPEEIEQKRKAALQRLRNKSGEPRLSVAAFDATSELSPIQGSPEKVTCEPSPIKYSQEEIEFKRQLARDRRRQAQRCRRFSEDSEPFSSQDSPLKNSQETGQWGSVGTLRGLDPKHGANQEVLCSQEISPIKCSPQEIEQKRQAALERRHQKGSVKKGAQEGGSSQEAVYSYHSKCDANDIEHKKQIALERRKQREHAKVNLNINRL